MCRGYQAAVRALEQARAPDDAYQLGRCPRTGTVVVIGDQKAAIARVRKLHGDDVIWIMNALRSSTNPEQRRHLVGRAGRFKGWEVLPALDGTVRIPSAPGYLRLIAAACRHHNWRRRIPSRKAPASRAPDHRCNELSNGR